MPSVSFDSLSFLLDGARSRASRLTVAAASFDATLVDPTLWEATLGELRHAGFNAVVIRVPWALHEPTPDRFVFTGACDLRRAIELAAAAGLKVMLRIGPCVGGTYAHGGLPVWLRDVVGPRLREANPVFLARVSQFWRALSPHFVDLLATRNGSNAPRAVIAVGIEDDWRSLDGAVGEAYFGALVRFAREVGIDVPLFTANNCWYTHDGLLDAWQKPSAVTRTAHELRQVQPDAPPFLMHDPLQRDGAVSSDSRRVAAASAAVLVAESIASRADFVCDVVGTRHTEATSATGCAERPSIDTFLMRRALVFATTFAETFAAMKPSAIQTAVQSSTQSGGTHLAAVHLAGERAERCTVVLGLNGERSEAKATARTTAKATTKQTTKATTKQGSAKPAPIVKVTHHAADGSTQMIVPSTESPVDFYASDLPIGTARLERCTGSLVALLGDIVVVTGAARTKITVKVDGSAVALTVPAEGRPPKITKVRGLRFAVVTHAMACGVGLLDDGIEFVDREGEVLARIRQNGVIEEGSTKQRAARSRSELASAVTLSSPVALVESGLIDGSHPRFASVTSPSSLGAYGLMAMHGYYRARFQTSKRKGSEVLALASGVRAEHRSAAKKGSETRVFEIGADVLPAFSGHHDERLGLYRRGLEGPLCEVQPLKSVKSALVELPDFDATTLGTFVWGYEPRGALGARTTVRWTFAARTGSVVLRFPNWWRDEGHARMGHCMRLNGALLDADFSATNTAILDGAKLSPMRPAPLAKGEKPPKGRNIKLVPGENELLLDLDPHAALDDARLKRLAKEMEFLEVREEFAATWAFACVRPPSSWSLAQPLARRGRSNSSAAAAASTAALPTWFRWTFSMETMPTSADKCVLFVEHPAGELATILVNGAAAMALDGVSGERTGTAKKPQSRRTLQLTASQLRVGENEICAFSPNGVMPVVSVHCEAR
ncbi:MAG: hypothetical protein RL591_1443 [Planctomycetota bacterium]